MRPVRPHHVRTVRPVTALVVFLATTVVLVLAALGWVIYEIHRAPVIPPDHPDYWTGRQIRSGERDAWLRERGEPGA